MGPPVVEPLLYQSYEQQQFHEIMILLEWLDNKKTPILMGDFNHGPVTVACSSWILPLHYGLLTARGMMSPYAMGEGVCTYYDYDSNWQVVIDHIYIPAHMHEKFEDVRVCFDMALHALYLLPCHHFNSISFSMRRLAMELASLLILQ